MGGQKDIPCGVIRDFFCVGDSTGNWRPGLANCVDNSEVPVQSEPNISDELDEARIRIQERAQVPEQELIDYINQSTTEIKEFLNQFAEERYANHKLKFNLKTLDGLTKNFCTEVSGFIFGKIEPRLAPEDKEGSLILAEPDDTKRKKNFDAFLERLFRNALKDLSSKTKVFFQGLMDCLLRDVSLLEAKLADKGKSSDKLDDVSQQIKATIAEKIDCACAVLKVHLDESKQNFPVKSIRLRDIAAELNFMVSGDDELEIYALKYAHEADENSLAIAYSDKDVINTAAQAVLTEPRILHVAKSFLYSGFNELNAAIIKVARLFIAEGIYPDYEKFFEQTQSNGSMFGANVTIGEGTIIAPFVSVGENVSIGANCRIDSGVFIGSGTVIGDGVKILAGSRVGVNCHYHYEVDGKQKSFYGVGRTIIGDGVEIGANTVIQRGSFSDTVIGAGTIIGNLVEIAHDVKIGEDCLIVSQVGLCGNVTIGDRVQIFGQAGVKDWVTVSDGAIILAKSGVTKNIKAGQKVSGMFSREHRTELKRLAKSKIIREE